MKRWRCLHCWAPEVAEAEWEDHLTQSFCRLCGSAGTRIYEFGCFVCDDQGVIFWGEEAPSHPCPDCNSPSYRIVHAPYVASPERRADFKAADRLLETELTNQNRSLSTFERNAKPVDERVAAARAQAQANGGLAGGWVAPAQVIGRAMPGSQANPLGTMPRPTTIIAGKYDKVD
jgi:hypothetical protein